MHKSKIARREDGKGYTSSSPIEASNSQLPRVQIPSDGNEEDGKIALLSCLRLPRTCHPSSCRVEGSLQSTAPILMRRPEAISKHARSLIRLHARKQPSSISRPAVVKSVSEPIKKYQSARSQVVVSM